MHPRSESGFTLIEALVAMMIVAMVVIEYIDIRTTALIDATQARNCRLAREIAEEKMSELQAGARETPPESGSTVDIEKYKGFSYKIEIGESRVAALEAEVATNAAGENTAATERLEWQRDRENYRRASEQGLSATEYQDKLLEEEDYQRRLATQAPSADDFEEVAVVVYFPKMPANYPDEKDALLIKARLSTLALSRLTPKQAADVALAKGQAAAPEGSAGSGASAGSGSGGKSNNSSSGSR